jgi:hypothetical protein
MDIQIEMIDQWARPRGVPQVAPFFKIVQNQAVALFFNYKVKIGK